jgi:hypothetical protein
VPTTERHVLAAAQPGNVVRQFVRHRQRCTVQQHWNHPQPVCQRLGDLAPYPICWVIDPALTNLVDQIQPVWPHGHQKHTACT